MDKMHVFNVDLKIAQNRIFVIYSPNLHEKADI